MKRKHWLAIGVLVPTILSMATLVYAATVTAVSNEQPALKAASTSGTSFTTDPYRQYTLVHTGKDAAGSDATGLVVIGVGANPAAADYSEDNNKFPLPSGSAIVVGPYTGTIYLRSASGAPMVGILPSGKVKP